MSRTALIVDDSPLARHVLGKLLAEHEITTDMAPSAEAALEYLKHRRPDVIFMDHLMPGMDGFDALEAIKANPATATIPVMMYTSQEGELYVGQARALGAFGVLPKDLKPVEVARVLQALHLIPSAVEVAGANPPGATAAADTPDSHRVEELLEELFYQQRAALREEIRDGYRRALAATHTQLPALPEEPPPRSRGSAARILAAGFAAVAAVFAYLYFGTTRLLDETTERSSQLIASSAQLSAASAQALDAQRAPVASDPGLLGALEWAFNLAGAYDFAAIPLDDARAQRFQQLIQYLSRVEFRGMVAIDVHVGRFCMNFALDGTPVLPSADQPAALCAQIGWPEAEAVALGRRQTLAFANMVAAATNATGIRVETSSLGSNEPLLEYPLLGDYVTAGEWNATAASNHRIAVRFIADAAVSRTRP